MHTEAELRIMEQYANAVNPEVLVFVQTIKSGKETPPVTVGFLTEKAAEEIRNLTGKETFGNRIVLDANAVIHILKRHGENGVQDESMQNIEDIARIGYVLENYDKIDFYNEYAQGYVDAQGKLAPKVIFSKRIDGTYYVIEAVSDAKKHKNYIVSAYIKKKSDSSVPNNA